MRCPEIFLDGDRQEQCQKKAGHSGEHYFKTKTVEIWWKTAADVERANEEERKSA